MLNTPIFRRTYALQILDSVSQGELTFTRLLRDTRISRGSLANTLKDLADGGLVRRRKIGRNVYYGITSAGLRTLRTRYKDQDQLEDRVAQIVYKRLVDQGALKGKALLKEKIFEMIRTRLGNLITAMIDDLRLEAEKVASEEAPATKAEWFASEKSLSALENVIDAKSLEALRQELARAKTLRQLAATVVEEPKRRPHLRREKLYIGCRTTRIFCRLTCPCRMPKPENLRFFTSAEEAISNGYRPCKICKPS